MALCICRRLIGHDIRGPGKALKENFLRSSRNAPGKGVRKGKRGERRSHSGGPSLQIKVNQGGEGRVKFSEGGGEV